MPLINTDMKNVKAIFSYGRMNPPTNGHLRVVQKLRDEAEREGAVARVYLSLTEDEKSNPLAPAEKLAFFQKLFPDVEVRLAKTVFEAGLDMAADGFDHGVMVVGEDRAAKFTKILSAYEGTEVLGLKRVEVKTISRNAEDASATQARQAAATGNWKAFCDLSATTDETLTRELYEAVRVGLGVA